MPTAFTLPEADDARGQLFYCDATIPNGQNQSEVVDVGDLTLVAVQIDPAGWTAAGLSFLACPTQTGTFGPLYDSNGEVAVGSGNVAAGNYVRLDAAQFVGVRYLKVRSGTAGSPVTQGGARTLRLVVRAL